MKLALHNVDYKIEGTFKDGWVNDKWKIITTITDTYDFAYNPNPQGALEKLVNYFYEDMQSGFLRSFKINIVIEDKIKI